MVASTAPVVSTLLHMKQTPAHELHNPELLALIPRDAKRLVEVGCSSGALAREFKKINADSHYTGIEISAEYGELARRYCDDVLIANIEEDSSSILSRTSGSDCWIFGDSLEYLVNPWGLKSDLQKAIDKSVVSSRESQTPGTTVRNYA